jgi:hypothetical protein
LVIWFRPGGWKKLLQKSAASANAELADAI